MIQFDFVCDNERLEFRYESTNLIVLVNNIFR